MKSIKIVGKKFKLASRMARLYALFIDWALLSFIQSILSIIVIFTSTILHINPVGTLPVMLTFSILSSVLWIFGLFFLDGFRKGQGFGKKLLSLQVIRLKDGKPCTFKDAFVRRFAGIFQPLDFFWSLGKKRQRLGDKFAETVVVQFETELAQLEVETEDPEQILEHAISQMKNRLSEARQKVDASIGVEKQFQDAYENALAQSERWQERAVIDLKAGREDLAREDLETNIDDWRTNTKHNGKNRHKSSEHSATSLNISSRK